MCVKSFFPDPPDPPALPPAATPPPAVSETKPKTQKLITPDQIAKVDYGSSPKRDKRPDAPKVSADSLKINLGNQNNNSANTGGLNV
tara:strand:+ start:203 stop:463 length:261 start_codon:yes stop_codon:yes gene_type:complete